MTDSESSGNICFVERHMRAARQEMQEWRNWQTRRLQVPVVARSCGFKSHLLHYFFALVSRIGPVDQFDYPAWNDAETSRQGLFISVRRRCADGEKKNRRISDSVKLFKIITIIHIFHKIKKLKFFQKSVDFSLESCYYLSCQADNR